MPIVNTVEMHYYALCMFIVQLIYAEPQQQQLGGWVLLCVCVCVCASTISWSVLFPLSCRLSVLAAVLVQGGAKHVGVVTKDINSSTGSVSVLGLKVDRYCS